MNRLMVKPIPHSSPSPTIAFQSMPSGKRENPVARASRAANTTPTGLPATRPSATPSGTGVSRSSSAKPPSARPALANANTGRMR